MIDLTLYPDVRERNIERCRERGIILPKFSEMRNPASMPEKIHTRLGEVGLWDVDPANLFRITWKNEPVAKGGTFGGVNYIELPPELTGAPCRILGIVGQWFPTGAHKVGATYGCLAPALVSGRYDAAHQKAVWPSTGNYCRGGAYNSALLGCDSIAILPEGMSRERFAWLKQIAGEVIATPGTESNVKEIFDACWDLRKSRGDDIVIFNQFEEFGNYLWHYEVTADAIVEMLAAAGVKPENYAGYVSSTGSGGTLAAGDKLKQLYPHSVVAAAEALQCPTLLRNGFGDHRIEGIGDKHVPWVHNVRNTDLVVAVDDQDCMDLTRVFNEDAGRAYLASRGISDETIESLPSLGISGIGNMLAAVKTAKYYELGPDDVMVTVITDSMELYNSRVDDLVEANGPLSEIDAARYFAGSIEKQNYLNVLELTYYERLRVHNLKYFTWVEQQGRDSEELNAQWYDREYWTNIQALAPKIDAMIDEFNKEVGLL